MYFLPLKKFWHTSQHTGM
uniref:Uncharacterized protein n=1 Tax=Arundo donax TaxID=35708 RepID=A0A0A9FJH1_ARUDO